MSLHLLGIWLTYTMESSLLCSMGNLIPILQEGEINCPRSHHFHTVVEGAPIKIHLPQSLLITSWVRWKCGLGRGNKPWVPPESDLSERKRVSLTEVSLSHKLSSLSGKTVMQFTVILLPLAGNNTGFCLIPAAAGRMRVLLMLESHFANGLWTQESLSGQGCVQACGRSPQSSRCGWPAAAVVCFWLQFHTSWQTICVKSAADSGCEIHRGKGARTHKASQHCQGTYSCVH